MNENTKCPKCGGQDFHYEQLRGLQWGEYWCEDCGEVLGQGDAFGTNFVPASEC